MHYSMPSCNNPVVHIVYFYWERGAGLNKTPKQMSSWRFIGSGAELTACFYWQQNCVETTRHFFCVSTHCARSPLHSKSANHLSALRPWLIPPINTKDVSCPFFFICTTIWNCLITVQNFYHETNLLYYYVLWFKLTFSVCSYCSKTD